MNQHHTSFGLQRLDARCFPQLCHLSSLTTATSSRSFPFPTGCSCSIHLSSHRLYQRKPFFISARSHSDFYPELGFKDKHSIPQNQPFKTQTPHLHQNSTDQNGIRDTPTSNFVGSSGGLKDKGEGQQIKKGKPTEDDLMRIQEEEEGFPMERRPVDIDIIGKRQMMKISTMIAKQVISIRSALSLGFVSQLWVDTNAWTVLIVEVRPNLLSGELERFFLADIAKVGDVLLIEDERVMENDFKLVGLETLVGYTVVTPGRQNIGKVRGYTFNINSGAVESLELDAFGISIIPSSLVSTYALFVEDVLEVLSDTVVVHEAAASRIQRLTKGFWGSAQDMSGSVDEFEECSDHRRVGAKSDHRERRKRNLGSWKFPQEKVEPADEWELPMDYL